MWIIVKVYHGDADKVHIETYLNRDLALNRITDLKEMTKEFLNDGKTIAEENESDNCNDNIYWWNITFNDGLLVTIDAREI
jgi:hypothetical protein